MIISGDKKTPHELYGKLSKDNDCVIYLDPEEQHKRWPQLSEAIGWNCIQRRNFSFLLAHELNCETYCSIDDDNIPYEHWGQSINVGSEIECDEWCTTEPAFDPLLATVHSQLWHRGYPLELVRDRYKQVLTLNPSVTRKCDVQANLWDGEADVDAICRLSYETSECRFRTPVRPFTSNKPSPFNSQNTFLSREVMPHYFMFPGIGRQDDIAASYHVQAQGFRVMYGGPTVVQKRNEHNTVTDMMNELWGIENNLAIVKEIPTNKNAVLDRLPPRALEAFRLYQKHFE